MIMSAEEEDKLREQVSDFIKDNKPISWCFLHKSQDEQGNYYTSCQGGFSNNDGFLMIKHLFKERPELKVAVRNLLK